MKFNTRYGVIEHIALTSQQIDEENRRRVEQLRPGEMYSPYLPMFSYGVVDPETFEPVSSKKDQS